MTDFVPVVPTLLRDFSSGQGSPALTWYGDNGERVELSGRVLANWVTKASNLLADEADAEPGTLVGLDTPAHWRAVVWALGAWACGAGVVTADLSGVDVLVSAATEPPAAPMLIAIALPALARSVPNVPAGGIDGAAELMAQPDVSLFAPDFDPGATGLDDLRHADLANPARLLDDPPTAGRHLLRAGNLSHCLRSCLAIWLTGGSVVLVGDEQADVARIAEQEGARAPGA